MSPLTLLPSLNPNTVIIHPTNSHPTLAKQIHQSARERCCYSVDPPSPVATSVLGMENWQSSQGDARVVEWLKPLFNELGKVSYLGSAGKGQSCKIANQVVVGGNMVGLSEGLVFAGKAGLDKEKFLVAVRGGTMGSMAMELFGKRMIDGDFKPGGFAEYMVKDLGMGEDAAAVVLPGAALSKQMFAAMVANGDKKMGTQGGCDSVGEDQWTEKLIASVGWNGIVFISGLMFRVSLPIDHLADCCSLNLVCFGID